MDVSAETSNKSCRRRRPATAAPQRAQRRRKNHQKDVHTEPASTHIASPFAEKPTAPPNEGTHIVLFVSHTSFAYSDGSPYLYTNLEKQTFNASLYAGTRYPTPIPNTPHSNKDCRRKRTATSSPLRSRRQPRNHEENPHIEPACIDIPAPSGKPRSVPPNQGSHLTLFGVHTLFTPLNFEMGLTPI